MCVFLFFYCFFFFTVASVLLTSSKLAIGTYEGEVHVYGLVPLLEGSKHTKLATLKAHTLTVYSLTSLKTVVTSEGYTTPFPTYLGRAQDNYARELLISIGFGRSYPEVCGQSKTFTSFSQGGGCYINTWFL